MFNIYLIIQNTEVLQELDENIEGLSAQVEYLQENINEHQNDIVQMMDGRESGDTIDLQVSSLSLSQSDSSILVTWSKLTNQRAFY